MSKHPVGVTPGAYNRNVMTVNFPLGPKKARRERGEEPGIASYAGVFGFSPAKLPTGRNY